MNALKVPRGKVTSAPVFTVFQELVHLIEHAWCFYDGDCHKASLVHSCGKMDTFTTGSERLSIKVSPSL